MHDIDYEKLGFMCGIEIHQQIDTHKLFCECPSLIREDEPDKKVMRKMRAVAGELGNVDPAALHEFLRNRILEYQAYNDTTCLVELDEEPPHPINKQALKTTLEVALLLNASILDEVHVMRKTVIDGSNTSGFQRTMLAAVDGQLETSEGTINIPSICLEEDAARIIETIGDTVVYRLDRLGIPLVEIATDPDIKNAKHAREVAEKLGSILRACKVKRGLGTIRQDINISIKDGERIEVKGVQDLKLISKFVESEVERQVMLIDIREKLNAAGVKVKDYDIEPIDVTDTIKDTESKVIVKSLESGGRVYAVKLTGLKGLLKDQLGPQLAQYARASSSLKGLFHTDELPGYGITEAEVVGLVNLLGLSEKDGFALVSGSKEECLKALNAVLDRCKKALDGVPEETRRPKDDGSTEYMRPLPGSARMYPETDEPIVNMTDQYLKTLRKGLPELREDKAKRYEDIGLSHELAGQISKSGMTKLFEELSTEYSEVNPTIIATTLTAYPKEAAKRHGFEQELITNEHLTSIIQLLSEEIITKNTVVDLLAKIAENPDVKAGETAEKNGLTTLSGRELKTIIEKIVLDNKDLDIGPLMGKVMAELKGRADADKVREIIKKLT